MGCLELDAYYSAAEFENDALRILDDLFTRNDHAILCGGSMMYIDAVCRGIDNLPTISPEVRAECLEFYEKEGLEGITARLRALDPAYLLTADLRNPRRLVHALEICLESGMPYSSLRTGTAKERPFAIRKYAIVPEREEMFARINRRVELMMEQGLLEEARRVYPLRHLNSLNTVGYKELFRYIDGEWDLATAVARIQKYTRVFAKKQLTWLKKSSGYTILPTPSLPLLLSTLDKNEK